MRVKKESKMTDNKTYFGLTIYDDNYVLEEDIKKLPFYEFWLKSSVGSTVLILDDKTNGIFLKDWEVFCKLFIETGKTRY